VWKERARVACLADLPMFAVGTVVAFFSALLCIRWLIRYVSSHDFTWLCLVPHRLWLRWCWLTAWGGWVTWAAVMLPHLGGGIRRGV
jgi:undecaprenyl-diphosphatase